MTFDNLLLERDGAVATLTINRPAVLNALDTPTTDELRHAVLHLKQDASVRVVIVTGAGEKAFIAGADINELAALRPTQGKEHAQRGQEVLQFIERFPKPVIAAINGFALGGGCELALACHIRIASENAQMGLPEVTLGIIPGYGGTQRMARLLGKGKALELICSGDRVKADEAERIGLVNRVVPLDQLLPVCEELAKKIASRAPLAVRAAIEAVVIGSEMPVEEGQLLEATLFGLLCATDDTKEGMRAFLEKRAANFTGK